MAGKGSKPKPDRHFVSRFWQFVDQRGSCWLWKGTFTVKGYGSYAARFMGQKFYRAHRFAWAIYNRMPVPKGMMVLHHCDNRWCVNPEHLYIGTNQDNCDDRAARERTARGRNTRHVKLTEAEVMEIRRSSERTVDLARRYGLHPNALWKARVGRSWKHLPMPEKKLPKGDRGDG